MNQIIKEYWSFDGSIEHVIQLELNEHPNYRIADYKILYDKNYGIYALVLYEEVEITEKLIDKN